MVLLPKEIRTRNYLLLSGNDASEKYQGKKKRTFFFLSLSQSPGWESCLVLLLVGIKVPQSFFVCFFL